MRRTQITIESHEVWTVRKPGRNSASWCRECTDPARMLSPEQAAELRGISTRTIYRWVEAGRVHFAETADGGVSVCVATLPERMCEASPPFKK